MKSLVLFVLLLPGACLAQTSAADIFNLYETTPSAPGTQLTATILGNGSIGLTGWASTGGSLSKMTVGPHQPKCNLPVTLTNGGISYTPQMLSQSFKMDMSTNFQYWQASAAGLNSQAVIIFCLTAPAVPTNLQDIIPVQDSTNGFSMFIQLDAQAGSPVINIETLNGGTHHSGYIALVPGTTYLVEALDDFTNGAVKLNVYSSQPPYTLVGAVTSTQYTSPSTVINAIRIGNAETGTSASTMYIEDLVLIPGATFPLTPTFNPPWAGILPASRAVDWSTPGVAGGIPTTYTQCGSTVAAGTSAASVQSLLAACSANTYLLLDAGTFNWLAGVQFNTGTRILRGSGADQTLIVLSAGSGCGGESAAICVRAADGNWPGGPIHTATFSGLGPWPRGTDTVTLSSVTGLAVGGLLVLDQVDDASGTQTLVTNPDTGAIYVCDAGGTNGTDGCSENGSGNEESGSQRGGGTNAVRDQQQYVTVTAINGTTVTFTPPLYMGNWRTSQSPGAWWSGNPVKYFGVENLSIDGTSGGGYSYNVEFVNCLNCWVKGVRSVNPGRAHFTSQYSARSTYQDNYLFGNTHTGTNCSGSQPCYGIELFGTSDTLEENNIIQKTSAPLMVNGAASGTVIAYNFAINNIYTGSSTWDQQMANSHSVTDSVLWEGNIGDGVYLDLFHGTGHFDTAFRNRLSGRAINNGTNTTAHTNAFLVYPYHRYMNLLGNVLGTSGYHTTYSANSDLAIYVIGTGTVNCCAGGDTLTGNSLLRWGNYDTVNAANRFVSGEVPSAFNDTTGTTSMFVNAVPASNNLPASFYYSSRPSWWPATKAWPLIGPDVAGGNITNVGGHAYTNPAQDCYTNTMSGPANGVGASPLTFNATTCYASVATAPPAAAMGLFATAH